MQWTKEKHHPEKIRKQISLFKKYRFQITIIGTCVSHYQMLLSHKYALEFWLMLDKRSETFNWPQISTCHFGDDSMF